MEVGTVRLRQARVGGVAEQDVVEGVAVVAWGGAWGGMDEAAAGEREEMADDVAVGECGDGVA